jgi:hypothetical protein
MRRFVRVMAFAALAAGAGACGGGGGDSPDGGGDDIGPSDGTPSCTIDVQYSPPDPTAGIGNTVSAHVVVSGADFLEYLWDVRTPAGVSLVLSPSSTADTVTFPIEAPGDYHVHVEVTSTFCQTYDAPLHVLAPGANTTTWRFRLTPPASTGAPPQEVVRSIPSLPSYDLGDVILDAGIPVDAIVKNGADEGVAAYLRVTSGSGFVVETYAAAGTGAVTANIPVGDVDVLVVPESNALAPLLVEDWNGVDDLTVDAGTLVTGTVLAPDGDPLAGARVHLVVDGVPSTIDTTDTTGTYRLRARIGGVVVVTVVPDDADGLPELTATLSSGLSSPLDVAYAPITVRSVAGTTIRSGGSPAANAVVTFTGQIASAGTASMGSVIEPAAGLVALTFVTNGAGNLVAPARAPGAALRAVIVPALLVAGIADVDLSGAVPAVIDAPAMASLTARVVGDDAGEIVGVGGVRVSAIPVGALALGTLTAASGISATDGTLALPVAAGGTYDVVFDDPHKRWARAWRMATGAGALGDVVVQPAMRVRGTIKQPGGASAVRSCAVQALCYGCDGIAAERPEGESSTNVTGGFSLTVTDPGVSAAAVAPAVLRVAR